MTVSDLPSDATGQGGADFVELLRKAKIDRPHLAALDQSESALGAREDVDFVTNPVYER
jgi:hypothetical protein